MLIRLLGPHAVTLALLSAAPSAAAQEAAFSNSILSLLPAAERLEIGSEVRGTLTESHLLTTAGQRVKAYELAGAAGDPVTIDLVSSDFDAYLFIVGPGYDEPFTDDDGGGQCNARLAVFLPGDGPYRVVVGALGGGTGDYQLRIDQRAAPVSDGECTGDPAMSLALAALVPVGEPLEVGSVVDDALNPFDATLPDATYARAYAIELDEGGGFSADLSSTAFDSLLRLLSPDGGLLASDDDGAGGCDARITFEAAAAGTYALVVGTLVQGEGPFRLTIASEPGPADMAACGL